MTDKLVTIVVPVAHSEPYLDTCLESLINQSYGEIEIFVVGSALDSDTRSRFEPFSDAVVYIEQRGGTGPGHARNMALERSAGEYVAFCDADDYYHITHVEKELDTLTSSAAGLTYGDYTFINAAGSETLSVTIPEWDFKSWIRKWYIALSTVMTTREALVRVRLFDEHLPIAEDFDLLWKLSDIIPFARTPGLLTYRRIHPLNTSRATLTLLTSRYQVYKSHGRPYAGLLSFARGLIVEPALRFLYGHTSLYASVRRLMR